jgi:arsenite methyltransferase
VVVDFGCGGGIDVILSAREVGPLGTVIGIDFAPQMIERAHQAVAEAGLEGRDIKLHVADMSQTLLEAGIADVIISNCVINLCPDKDAVYREAFRILRSGGHVAISDIVLTEPLDPDVEKRCRATWAGCLGGAIPEVDYWQAVRKAGFDDVKVVARHILTPEELEVLASCPGPEFTPPPSAEDRALAEGKATSVKFTASR